MAMSPGQVHMLLHLYFSADDYRGGDYSAPAVKEWVRNFQHRGILTEKIPRQSALRDEDGDMRSYHLTEKGNALVRAICATPWPVEESVWKVNGKIV